MPEMTELQLDLLSELVNIGVGQASAGLSQLLTTEITLSIPKLEFLSKEEILARFPAENTLIAKDFFNGEISGEAFLIFTESEKYALVNNVFQQQSSSIAESELDVVQEVANIVIHTCLSSLADNLKISFEMSVPTAQRGAFADSIEHMANSIIMLYVYMGFQVEEKGIHGFLSLMMDHDATAVLQQKLDQYLMNI